MTKNYTEAQSDARETALNYFDEIVEQILESGEADKDLRDDKIYPNGDEWHHSNHVDKDLDLLEAAQILQDYGEYEETDDGLWEGLEPVKAVICQACFTYGNAVWSMWELLIDEINDDRGLFELGGERQAIKTEIEEVENEASKDDNIDPLPKLEELQDKETNLTHQIKTRIREIIDNF